MFLNYSIDYPLFGTGERTLGIWKSGKIFHLPMDNFILLDAWKKKLFANSFHDNLDNVSLWHALPASSTILSLHLPSDLFLRHCKEGSLRDVGANALNCDIEVNEFALCNKVYFQTNKLGKGMNFRIIANLGRSTLIGF